MKIFLPIEAASGWDYSPEVVGGKASGLAWMISNEVSVPPAMVIPTDVCVEYMKDPAGVMKQVEKALPEVYEFFQAKLGMMPLVSVRSGARVSMPGMMDTILNVGIDAQSEKFWRDRLGEECAANSMKRLVEMYGSVVKGIDRKEFDQCDVFDAMEVYSERTGEKFPGSKEQLLGSIEAVFRSWNNDRAKYYRKMHNIPEAWGTAVLVQAMVFGNLNDKSATGVLFSRNPDDGTKEVTGEYLVNAQGEDVVAGIRTPEHLSQMHKWNKKVADELYAVAVKLERLRNEVQDIEFTVEDGKLWILQTRTAKRTAKAAVKIALDMYKEGKLGREVALKRVTKSQYYLANQPIIDPAFKKKPAYSGISACSGVASGIGVLSSDALNCKGPFILVGVETTPDDIAAMDKSVGVLTMHGGSTSHAAVVARSMNKPCVVGVGKEVSEFVGKEITIDGATGRVWLEKAPIMGGNDETLKEFEALMLGDSIGIGVPASVTVVNVSDYLKMNDIEGAAAQIKKFVDGKRKVVVDMSSEKSEFFDMFSIPVDQYIKACEALYSELKSSIAKSVLDQVAFNGVAVPSGFKSIKIALTLDDLISAEELAIWKGAVTPSVKKLAKLKAASGEKVAAMGGEEPFIPMLSKSAAANLMLS